MTSTSSNVAYNYLSESPFDVRIRYNYAPNHGQGFLDAWQHQRQSIAKQLPNPVKHTIMDAPPLSGLKLRVQTKQLLNALLAHVSSESVPSSLTQEWLKILVRKFETTGRLHEEYSEQFLAIDKTRCRNINLYVTFCEILIAAQRNTPKLFYFNALLKGLDILCSLHHELDDNEAGRTAYLIAMEAELSQRLHSSVDKMP